MSVKKLVLGSASLVVWTTISILASVNTASAVSVKFDGQNGDTWTYGVVILPGEVINIGDVLSLTGMSGVKGQSDGPLGAFEKAGFTSSSATWKATGRTTLNGGVSGVIAPFQITANKPQGKGNWSLKGESGTTTVPVPEPLTILGSGMALGFGGLFKKEYSKVQKKVRNLKRKEI